MKSRITMHMFLFFLASFFLMRCNGEKPIQKEKTNLASTEQTLLVTFIEIGSVRCIPCKKMQPIIKEIENEYRGQVKVIFYDVWTPEGRPYGQQYGIRLIPTQIFLDSDGKEYYRHEGFFPKEELVKILQMKGVR